MYRTGSAKQLDAVRSSTVYMHGWEKGTSCTVTLIYRSVVTDMQYCRIWPRDPCPRRQAHHVLFNFWRFLNPLPGHETLTFWRSDSDESSQPYLLADNSVQFQGVHPQDPCRYSTIFLHLCRRLPGPITIYHSIKVQDAMRDTSNGVNLAYRAVHSSW